MENIKEYTQYRLDNWFINAKRDHNIDGKATIFINGTDIEIHTEEDNKHDVFTYDTTWLDSEKKDQLFNIWMER